MGLPEHKIAETINAVRDVAIEFAGTQQLRERIAEVFLPVLRGLSESEEISGDHMHVSEFIDLCNSFSARTGSIYIGDIKAALNGWSNKVEPNDVAVDNAIDDKNESNVEPIEAGDIITGDRLEIGMTVKRYVSGVYLNAHESIVDGDGPYYKNALYASDIFLVVKL